MIFCFGSGAGDEGGGEGIGKDTEFSRRPGQAFLSKYKHTELSPSCSFNPIQRFCSRNIRVPQFCLSRLDGKIPGVWGNFNLIK